MLTVFLTISFFKAFYSLAFVLPESAILLFLGIGLIAAAFAARLLSKKTAKSSKDLAEIHLSQHGGNVRIGN